VDEKVEQVKQVAELATIVGGFAISITYSITIPVELPTALLHTYTACGTLATCASLVSAGSCVFVLIALFTFDCRKENSEVESQSSAVSEVAELAPRNAKNMEPLRESTTKFPNSRPLQAFTSSTDRVSMVDKSSSGRVLNQPNSNRQPLEFSIPYSHSTSSSKATWSESAFGARINFGEYWIQNCETPFFVCLRLLLFAVLCFVCFLLQAMWVISWDHRDKHVLAALVGSLFVIFSAFWLARVYIKWIDFVLYSNKAAVPERLQPKVSRENPIDLLPPNTPVSIRAYIRELLEPRN
jgi:hypothetical protein